MVSSFDVVDDVVGLAVVAGVSSVGGITWEILEDSKDKSLHTNNYNR